MRRPTMSRRVNNHLQLHINSRRDQNIAERRKILRQSSTGTGDQERITMLKKKTTMKKKATSPPLIPRSHPPPSPRRFRSSLGTESEEGPTTEKTMTRANRGLFPSFLKRRGVASKGMQLKRGGGARAFTMGKGRDMTDDDTEVDTDSDSGITDNGVLTRFFGGDEVTSSGSFETTSVLTSDDGGFWNSLHRSMCGYCP